MSQLFVYGVSLIDRVTDSWAGALTLVSGSSIIPNGIALPTGIVWEGNLPEATLRPSG